MTALKYSWQYFPGKKGLISGLIISSYSLGAIIWIPLTKLIANPHNQKPKPFITPTGVTEYFYDEDSDVVKNVPQMLRVLAYIYLSMVFVSMILINKRGVGLDSQDKIRDSEALINEANRF